MSDAEIKGIQERGFWFNLDFAKGKKTLDFFRDPKQLEPKLSKYLKKNQKIV